MGIDPYEIESAHSGIDPYETEIVQRCRRTDEDKVFRVSVISSGDPLEIYTEKDGEVIFKKYSPMGDLTEFAAQICEVDRQEHRPYRRRLRPGRDHCGAMACSGASFMDKHCSQELEQLMEAAEQSTAISRGRQRSARPADGRIRAVPSSASQRAHCDPRAT